MYYNDLIAIIDKKIKKEEATSAELITELQKYIGLEKVESSDIPFMNNLRKQIDACSKNILAYNKERETIINTILKAGSISIDELIWLLEQAGLYYKTINHNGKVLIVPIDYCLIPGKSLPDNELARIREEKIYNGELSVAEQGLKVMPTLKTVEQYNVYEIITLDDETLEYKKEALRRQAKAVQKQEKAKSGRVGSIISNLFSKTEEVSEPDIEREEHRLLNKTPMTAAELAEFQNGFSKEEQSNFIVEKLPNKVMSNDYLSDMTPMLELGINEGVRIYVREGNNVKLNPALLNICDYQMLSFLENYTHSRYQDITLDLKKFYNHVQSPKVLKASANDQIYKVTSSEIALDTQKEISFYAKAFIGFHNKVLEEYPHLSRLEIWTKFFDMAQAQGWENKAIDEDILSLFSMDDIEFMDYYQGNKKANPSLTLSVIENSYVKNNAGRLAR